MQRLLDGASALGLRLTLDQQASFALYYEELVAWNQKFNLTAITEYEQVQIRHFLDSLSCLLAQEARQALSQPDACMIDVGSGAGFPGIPLKLVCANAQLTLLEAKATRTPRPEMGKSPTRLASAIRGYQVKAFLVHSGAGRRADPTALCAGVKAVGLTRLDKTVA